MTRAGWSETWLKVAETVGARSACCRRKAGCVIVDEYNRVVGTGYNGPAAGYVQLGDDANCKDWCPRGKEPHPSTSYENCVAIHAEANALLYSEASARSSGVAYCTSCPCYSCAQLLSNSGISVVVCNVLAVDRDRAPEKSLSYMLKSGLDVIVYSALAEFREQFIKIGIRPLEWVYDADPA